MVVDFIMLSLVQAIIAAEAGVSANAEADSIAAVINVFMLNLAGKKPTGPPANGIRIFHPERFGKKTFFQCCVATASRRLANRGAVGRQLRTCPARASLNSRLWLGVLGDAADRYLGFAGGLAAHRRLTAVDTAVQAVDQSGAVLGRTFDPDIAGTERIDQCREQDRHRNHGRADQDRQHTDVDGSLRCAATRPLIVILTFR